MKKKHTYIWQGITTHGQQISGEIAASSFNLAKHYLLKKQIQFSTLKRKRPSWATWNRKITANDFILFFRQLSTLILAGITIIQAISLISHTQKNNKLLPLLTQLKNDLHAGHSFVTCLRKFPNYFDEITCNLIDAGEKSGTLDIMLERIATYKETSALLKNKISQALFYPSLTVIVAILSSFIMLTFIIPRFAELFQTMHVQLPTLTLCVIHIANFFQRNFSWISCMIALLIIGLLYAKRWPRAHMLIDSILIQLPLLGTPLTKFILARFSRSLAIIFASGIPITESLKILTHSTGNLRYMHALQKLHFEISSGKQLHSAMQNNPLFPIMMQQMIRIGEESGTLEKMLHKIAEFYEKDIDHFIGHLSKLLEPLIMIILGVLIGGLVIAMYLPIFKLGTAI